MLIPLILSGGSGTRLWPLSRELYPKQLLPLVGDRTMLQETAARVAGIPGVAAPIVVCNESHRFMVAEQLRESEAAPQAILLEPVGRNTAPAVAVAALVALELNPARRAGDPDPTLLVLPADHVIRDVAAFQAAVAAGRAAADAGELVTFGVVPDRAETPATRLRTPCAPGWSNCCARPAPIWSASARPPAWSRPSRRWPRRSTAAKCWWPATRPASSSRMSPRFAARWCRSKARRTICPALCRCW